MTSKNMHKHAKSAEPEEKNRKKKEKKREEGFEPPNNRSQRANGSLRRRADTCILQAVALAAWPLPQGKSISTSWTQCTTQHIFADAQEQVPCAPVHCGEQKQCFYAPAPTSDEYNGPEGTFVRAYFKVALSNPRPPA